MDLTSIMRKDSAIVDLEWMKSKGGLIQGEEPLINVEELKKPNNIKPELEVQWGGGGPNIDFDEPAGEVKRDLDGDGVPESVITFARDMMNRGFMGRDLNRALRGRFDAGALKSASAGLRAQLQLEGIVGCIAVDGRGYQDCKEALKSASLSPNKRFIRYVIGCECGTPHVMPRVPKGDLMGVGESSGSAVDDFLASDAPQRAEMVPHCQSTMLPIIGQDIDPSEVQDGLMDMMNVLELPQDEVDKMWKQKHNNKYSTNLAVFQAAFKWLQKAREVRENQEYAASVDTSEHVIEPSEPVVVIGAAPVGQIDIDPTNPSRDIHIAVDAPAPSTTFDGMQDLGSEIVAELADIPTVDPIDIALESDVPVQVNKEADAQLDVAPGGLFDGLELARKHVSEDIDFQPHLAEEFEGTDQIDLEAPKAPPGELDISF